MTNIIASKTIHFNERVNPLYFLNKKNSSPDIAKVIIQFLDYKSLVACQQVHFKNWPQFSIKVLSFEIPDHFFLSQSFLSHMTAIQVLNLEPFKGPLDLGQFSHMVALKSLNLSKCKVNPDSWGVLNTFTKLHCLDLTCSSIENWGFLKELIDLKSLILTCTSITELSNVANLSKLEKLHLAMCVHVTDEGLSHLASLTALKELNVHLCRSITNSGFTVLSKLTSLEELILEQTNIVDLSPLNHLTALKSLNLKSCHDFTEEDVAVLDSWGTSLERVWL